MTHGAPPPDQSPPGKTSGSESIHATAVEIEGRGLLILGPAGAGKSALALDLIALGARLVADDAVLVSRHGDALVARSPAAGDLIEARGIGILKVPLAGPTPLSLVIDLGRESTERLPRPLTWRRLGLSLPLIERPPLLQPSAVRAAVISGGPIDPEAPLGLASGAAAHQISDLHADSAREGA